MLHPKNLKQNLLPICLLAAVLGLPVAVQAQLAFTTNNSAITITGYNTTAGLNVVIPPATNGYPVTSIGDYAFEGSAVTNVGIPNSVTSFGYETFFGSAITSVAIGTNVTSVGNYAFNDCNSLTNISVAAANPDYSSLNGVLFDKAQTTLIQFPGGLGGSYVIPATVTSIADEAFADCVNLKSLTIPSGVTSIQSYAFYDLSSLTNFSVSASNPNYSGLSGVLFDKAQATLLQYPCGLGGVYTVPPTVTSIGLEAFFNSAIASVAMPNSVTSIGFDAFYGSPNLTSVTLGSGITSIANSAFYSCPALGSVFFLGNPPTPANDTSVFSGDTNAVAYYLSSATGWGATFDGLPTFLNPFTFATNGGAITVIGYNTAADLNAVIPPYYNSYPVTTVGSDVFYNSAITNLTIPNTVTSLGDYAFYDCFNLTSVTLPGSVTNLGIAVFEDCTSLTNLSVAAANPDFSSLNGVLFDKTQATLIQFPCGLGGSYLIPSSVTRIGEFAFYDSANLKSVTVPNTVTNIGLEAFLICNSLTNISVAALNPDYSSLNGVLFDKAQATLIQCPGGLVGGYIIPNTVTHIGDDAFFACASLTSVTISNNVTSIGQSVFESCTSLTNFSVAALNPDYSSLNGVLFDKTQATLLQFPPGLGGSYLIPNTVTTIGYEAFEESSLTNITIPTSVTSIGIYGFALCSSLPSISIPNSVTNIGGGAFLECYGLKRLIIPNSVTSLGSSAFAQCISLTNVTLGTGLTSIGSYAFDDCPALVSVYFKGNSPTPTNDTTVFSEDTSPIAYYLPKTTGWGATFDGIPAVLWNPQAKTLGFAGGHFGFNITGPTNTTIVVQACTNLVQSVWLPVTTNTLSGSGTASFSDPQPGNLRACFYRFTTP